VIEPPAPTAAFCGALKAPPVKPGAVNHCIHIVWLEQPLMTRTRACVAPADGEPGLKVPLELELEELLLEDELLLDEELEDELLDELLLELEELDDELLVVPSHTPRLVYQPQLGQ
jgi:hypothetical protein